MRRGSDRPPIPAMPAFSIERRVSRKTPSRVLPKKLPNECPACCAAMEQCAGRELDDIRTLRREGGSEKGRITSAKPSDSQCLTQEAIPMALEDGYWRGSQPPGHTNQRSLTMVGDANLRMWVPSAARQGLTYCGVQITVAVSITTGCFGLSL